MAPYPMIEQDEQIIGCLEELDYTFSQINKVLKSIKTKLSTVLKENTELPFLSGLFVAPVETVQLEPTDPFSISNDSLQEYDPSMLPQEFRQIDLVRDIFDFVSKKEKATIEEIYDEFGHMGEMVEVCVQVLVRKSFLRMRGNVFSV